jgi:hypothetical protein
MHICSSISNNICESLILQEAISFAWPKALRCSRTLYHYYCEHSDYAGDESTWFAQYSARIQAIAPGVLTNLLMVWDASAARDAGSANECTRIVEMCCQFALAWAWYGFDHEYLNMSAAAAKETSFRSAAQDANFTLLPDEGLMWSSVIDAQQAMWVPAAQRPQMNSMICSNPLVHSSSAAPVLCVLSQASCMVHNVVGHVLASEGSAIVLANCPAELVNAQRALDPLPVASHTASVYRLGKRCSALATPREFQVQLKP